MSVEEIVNYIMLGMGVIFTVSVPLAIFGLRLREGFWGNTICFCNLTFASLVAINYYEPVASLLGDAYSGGMFFYDFIAFWLLIALTFIILNMITNRLSKIKVHFPLNVERVGNGVLLFGILMNFVSLIAFSFPMAPFQPPDEAHKTTETNATEYFGRKVRILSLGSLAPFTYNKPWIDPNRYVDEQTNKRWAVYDAAASKNTFFFEGSPPPKRGGGSSSAE